MIRSFEQIVPYFHIDDNKNKLLEVAGDSLSILWFTGTLEKILLGEDTTGKPAGTGSYGSLSQRNLSPGS